MTIKAVILGLGVALGSLPACDLDGCPKGYISRNGSCMAGLVQPIEIPDARVEPPEAGLAREMTDAAAEGGAPSASDGSVDPAAADSGDELAAAAGACSDGASEPCDNAGLGVCAPGTRRCDAGVWGLCESTEQVQPERCDGLDSDCDGIDDVTQNPCPDGQHCERHAAGFRCAQCSEDSDCLDGTECATRTCNLTTGLCESTAKDGWQPCSTEDGPGYCAAGSCAGVYAIKTLAIEAKTPYVSAPSGDQQPLRASAASISKSERFVRIMDRRQADHFFLVAEQSQTFITRRGELLFTGGTEANAESFLQRGPDTRATLEGTNQRLLKTPLDQGVSSGPVQVATPPESPGPWEQLSLLRQP
ncbi:MAG: hypothetical protein ABW321_20835 [Polyangiales bacterium]